MLVSSADVSLVTQEGYLYATNSVTSTSGPVCDDHFGTSIWLLHKKDFSAYLFWAFSAVILVGGTGPQEGYVYALNPATQNYGPVCDDYFDIKAVSENLVVTKIVIDNFMFNKSNLNSRLKLFASS